MSSNGPLAAASPREADRSPAADACVRRMARVAELNEASRVLDLGCGSGHNSVLIAREFAASVVAVDEDARCVELLRERLVQLGLSQQVEVKKADSLHSRVTEEQFNAVILYPKLLLPFVAGAALLRQYLKPDGRLMIGYPVRVGRRSIASILEFWEQRLGEPLLLPGELLQLLAGAGYEPEVISNEDGAPLDPFYEVAERELKDQGDGPDARISSLREEISRHRSERDGSVSFAQIIARRKEPGEKPALRRRA